MNSNENLIKKNFEFIKVLQTLWKYLFSENNLYWIYYENMASAFPNYAIRLQLFIHFFNFEKIQNTKILQKINLWMIRYNQVEFWM